MTVKFSFLPYICDEYPEATGWVEKEFKSESAAVLWFTLNADCVELVRYPPNEGYMDLRTFLDAGGCKFI